MLGGRKVRMKAEHRHQKGSVGQLFFHSKCLSVERFWLISSFPILFTCSTMSVIRCTIPGCIRTFRRKGHLTLHMNSTHSNHHRAPPPTPYSEPSPAPTSPRSPQSDFSIPPNEDPPFGMDMPPRSPSPSAPKAEKIYHPHLNGLSFRLT